jgi:hypothetical protein
MQRLTSYFAHGAHYGRNVTHHIFFFKPINAHKSNVYIVHAGQTLTAALHLLHAALRQIRKTFCILSKIYTVSVTPIKVRTANLTAHVVRVN